MVVGVLNIWEIVNKNYLDNNNINKIYKYNKMLLYLLIILTIIFLTIFFYNYQNRVNEHIKKTDDMHNMIEEMYKKV